MDLKEFNALLQTIPETVRESLAAIENAVQANDDPRLYEVSRFYAGIVSAVRDYLSGAQIGRAFPRRLAKNLSESAGHLVDHEEAIVELHLHPDLDELAQLIQRAETVA